MNGVTKVKRMRAGILALIFAASSTLVAIAACELLLRLAVEPHKLLSRYSDAYWQQRLVDRLDRLSPGEKPYRSVHVDPNLGWLPIPGLRQEKPGESTNSRGLRGSQEYAYERASGVARILVLGDSFTYGFGVRDEETFSYRLQLLLGDTEVLNLGVNGFGTDQQILYFEREGRKYSADLVLLVVYYDDFHRNVLSFRELPKPRFYLDGDGLAVASFPRLADLRETPPEIKRSPLRLLDGFHLWRERTFGLPQSEQAGKEELFRSILDRLQRRVRGLGAELKVVVIGSRPGGGDSVSVGISHLIASVCRSLEAPYLDVLSVLDERDLPGLYAPNGHWNVRGHGLAAQAIADFVRCQRGLENEE